MARKYRPTKNKSVVLLVVKLPELLIHSQVNTRSTNKEVDLEVASQQLHSPEAISIKIHSLV